MSRRLRQTLRWIVVCGVLIAAVVLVVDRFRHAQLTEAEWIIYTVQRVTP